MNDSRLDILRHQIQQSDDHRPEEKADMADTLHLAEQIPDGNNVIHAALRTMLINGVRRELRDPGRTLRIATAAANEAVVKHARDCSGKTGSLITLEKGKLRVSGQAAIVLSIVVAVVALGAGWNWWQQHETRARLAALHIQTP